MNMLWTLHFEWEADPCGVNYNEKLGKCNIQTNAALKNKK